MWFDEIKNIFLSSFLLLLSTFRALALIIYLPRQVLSSLCRFYLLAIYDGSNADSRECCHGDQCPSDQTERGHGPSSTGRAVPLIVTPPATVTK